MSQTVILTLTTCSVLIHVPQGSGGLIHSADTQISNNGLQNENEAIPEILVDENKRSVDSCSENTPNPLYTVNNTLFCKCCLPGFYKSRDCSVSGEKAICLPCPTNHYNEKHSQATRCSLCQEPSLCTRPHAYRVRECNRTSNIECGCRDGYYLKRRIGSAGDGDCVPHSPCGPGKFVISNGKLTELI